MSNLYSKVFIVLLLPVLFVLPIKAQTQEFTVGALVPITGSWQSVGTGANAAIHLAHEHIEAYLNPLGYSVNVIVRDTQSEPARALEELKDLHAMGIRLVVGPMTSEEAAAVVEYANENDILLVSPSSSSEELYLEDNLYRLAPTDTIQALVLSVFMATEGIRNVVPIYIDDNYGKSFFEYISLYNAILGINHSSESFAFSPETTDFSEIVRKAEEAISAMNYSYPDSCVFFIGNEDHIKNLIGQIPDYSPLRYLQWFSSEAIVGSASLLQDEAVSDFLFRTSLTGSSLDARDVFKDIYVENIYQQLTDVLGTEPSYYSLLTYDALWIASRLYDAEIDSISFDGLRGLFEREAMHYYGLSGRAKFDDFGDKETFTYAFMRADRWNGENRWNTIAYFTYNNGDITGANRDYQHDGYRSYGYNPLLFVPDEKETVPIGALLPLTGSLSSHGLMAERSLRAGLKTINHIFDERGYRLQFELIVKDTQTNPDVALQELTNLHGEGVEVVVGPLASSCATILEEFAAENDLILISPMSTAVSLAKEDRIIRMTPNDYSQAAAIAAFLKRAKVESLLILHRDDAYGQDLASVLSESYAGEVLSVQAYPIQEGDFSAYLQALEGALTESTLPSTAVVAIGFDELASCIGQIPESSLLRDVRWIGTDGFVNNRKVVDDPQLANTAVEMGLTCSNVPGSNFIFFSVQSQILFQEMAALGGDIPLELMPTHVNSYDALWLAASLYQAVGTEKPLADEWNYFKYRFFENRIGDIRGTYGPLVFDENEDKTDYYYDFNSVVLDDSDEYVWKRTAVYIDMDEISPEPVLLDLTVIPGSPVEQWSLY